MEPKYYDYVGKDFFDLHRAWNLLEEYPRMIKAWAEQEVKIQRCFPDWQAIKDNPDRIPEEYLPDILERASKLEGIGNLTFVNCPCKAMEPEAYQKVWDEAAKKGWSKDSPGSPADIKDCFQMGRSADYSLRRGTGRNVTVEEALQVFKEEEERGAVHLSVGNVKIIPGGLFWMICNCYKSSCDVIDPALQAGLPVAATMCVPSRYRTFVDVDKCKGCQTCVERCFFGAAKMKQYPGETKWKAWVDPDICIGCGSCTLTCPALARTLKCVRPLDSIPDEAQQVEF